MTVPEDGFTSMGDAVTPSIAAQGRRGQRQVRTLAQLIAGARTVFARVSVADATIAQITAEANVGFGTFYLYFKTKEDALHAVLLEGFTPLNAQLDALLQQAREQQQPWEETVKDAVVAYLRFASQNRDLMQIVFAEQTRLQQVEWQVFLRFAWRMVQMVQYAQASLAGITPSPDVVPIPDASTVIYPFNLLAAMMVALLNRTAIWWLRRHPEEHDQEPPSLDEAGALTARFLIAGLTSVLTPEPQPTRKEPEYDH
ncbi:MAG: TetR/AcrR family transcriptional regulator [Ktedonobacteraceae bacterium]|nr:TetR/AcrR family transcriptional regulator [Ktedonobacteraceae bacterium]